MLVGSILRTAAESYPPSNEVVSGIFGSISLTAWITVLLPQLHANYKAGRADGLSTTFLFIWLAGDAANFVGAILARLAPMAVTLAGYFVIADLILITQCLYYNKSNGRSKPSSFDEQESTQEQAPLLSPSASDMPAKETTTRKSLILWNTFCLLMVVLIGCVGWILSYELGFWNDSESSDEGPSRESEAVFANVGIVLGYASATCYLFARIPQIIKNHREKSCEGLALLFFLLSVTGNVTYSISLVAFSQDKEFLVSAIPWLLGSIGTVGEDVIVFLQFRWYQTGRKEINVE